jgi:hypothetical protein
MQAPVMQVPGMPPMIQKPRELGSLPDKHTEGNEDPLEGIVQILEKADEGDYGDHGPPTISRQVLEMTAKDHVKSKDPLAGVVDALEIYESGRWVESVPVDPEDLHEEAEGSVDYVMGTEILIACGDAATPDREIKQTALIKSQAALADAQARAEAAKKALAAARSKTVDDAIKIEVPSFSLKPADDDIPGLPKVDLPEVAGDVIAAELGISMPTMPWDQKRSGLETGGLAALNTMAMLDPTGLSAGLTATVDVADYLYHELFDKKEPSVSLTSMKASAGEFGALSEAQKKAIETSKTGVAAAKDSAAAALQSLKDYKKSAAAQRGTSAPLTVTKINVPSFSLSGDATMIGAKAASGGAKPGKPGASKTGGKTGGKGGIITKKAGKTKPSPHHSAVERMQKSIKRLAATHGYLDKRASQYKPEQHTTLIPLAPISVKGEICLGTDKPLTPAQQAAVKKHNDSIVRHAKAVDNLKKASARVKQAKAKVQNVYNKAKPVFDKYSPRGKGKTAIKGDFVLGNDGYAWPEVVGSDYAWPEVVGSDYAWPEVVGDDFINEIEMVVLGEDPPTDPSTSPTDPTDGSGDSGPPGTVPLPQRDQDLSADEANKRHDTVPDDAVVYDGSLGYPDHSLASYSMAYAGFPANQHWPNEQKGVNGYWWMAQDGGQQWWWVHDGHGEHDAESRMTIQEVAKQSLANQCGPLVGHPKGPLKGLQYAILDNKWFWMNANAPSTYGPVADMDAKLKAANDAIKEAADAEAKANEARLAKEKADQDEAQAKQDAANALAQSAADAQEKIAQQAQAAKQAELDTRQREQDIKDASAVSKLEATAAAQDLQKSQTQLQFEKDSAMQQAQYAQMQLEYMKAHPEAMQDGPPSMTPPGEGESGPQAGPQDEYTQAANEMKQEVSGYYDSGHVVLGGGSDYGDLDWEEIY